MPSTGEIKIAVLKTPKISNFTDFDCLANEPDVALYYVQPGDTLGDPDLILLPGSKNTTEDLLYLRERGYEAMIKAKVDQGTALIGVCGGYQMLGSSIHDPEHTESNLDAVIGLNLLPVKTTFIAEKLTTQVIAAYDSAQFLHAKIAAQDLHGYEIHMGRTEFTASVAHPFRITARSEEQVNVADGAVSENGLVMGTYIHGIFDNDTFRRSLLNAIRERKGLAPLENMVNSYAQKQYSYNRLADTVRKNINMKLLAEIMGR